MDCKSFCARGWSTRLAFYVGKFAPLPVGYAIADLTARFLVTTKPRLYHNVYDNQRRVLGESAPPAVIHNNVHAVFRHAARSYCEIFNNLGWGRTSMRDFVPPITFLPSSWQNLQTAKASGKGLFLLGCHLSNFDLAGMAFSQAIWTRPQVVSLPNPPEGFRFFNQLRARTGMYVTPSSPAALREALSRLRRGGVVITGVDRPISGEGPPISFFGAPALLPTGYIRLALRTRCLVATIGCVQKAGNYHIIVNPPMEMVDTGDVAQDVIRNARRVLTELEGLIQRNPEQWMMFVPVWQDA